MRRAARRIASWNASSFISRTNWPTNRDQPAITADGVELSFLANINNVADVQAAKAMGAAGIGLFRTEYLYLTHPGIPDEEDQLKTYRAIIAAAPQHQVTIRTLDIGGDKTVPYLGHHHKEANPFLGWRSIRLSFEHPEIFLTQLRAILRAAAFARAKRGEVRIMFPMITTLEEINRVRKMVRRASLQLEAEGKDFVPAPIGMMLEVPAAAISIDTLLHAVDFVSIGSNDLVQYLMAADRDNPKVSHLCQPLAPPVLHVLTRVVEACVQADKPLDAVRGNGRPAPRLRAAVGHGLAQFQHESGLRAVHEGPRVACHDSASPRAAAARPAHEDDHAHQALHARPAHTDRPEPELAGFRVAPPWRGPAPHRPPSPAPLDLGLGLHTDEALDILAVLEHDERRNTEHLVFLRHAWALVDVQFADLDGAHDTPRPVPRSWARSARHGPHQVAQKSTRTGTVRLQNFRLEIVVRKMRHVAHRRSLPGIMN